eukprot:217741-Hanusia_phi.AAC.1
MIVWQRIGCDEEVQLIVMTSRENEHLGRCGSRQQSPRKSRGLFAPPSPPRSRTSSPRASSTAEPHPVQSPPSQASRYTRSPGSAKPAPSPLPPLAGSSGRRLPLLARKCSSTTRLTATRSTRCCTPSASLPAAMALAVCNHSARALQGEGAWRAWKAGRPVGEEETGGTGKAQTVGKEGAGRAGKAGGLTRSVGEGARGALVASGELGGVGVEAKWTREAAAERGVAVSSRGAGKALVLLRVWREAGQAHQLREIHSRRSSARGAGSSSSNVGAGGNRAEVTDRVPRHVLKGFKRTSDAVTEVVMAKEAGGADADAASCRRRLMLAAGLTVKTCLTTGESAVGAG